MKWKRMWNFSCRNFAKSLRKDVPRRHVTKHRYTSAQTSSTKFWIPFYGLLANASPTVAWKLIWIEKWKCCQAICKTADTVIPVSPLNIDRMVTSVQRRMSSRNDKQRRVYNFLTTQIHSWKSWSESVRICSELFKISNFTYSHIYLYIRFRV